MFDSRKLNLRLFTNALKLDKQVNYSYIMVARNYRPISLTCIICKILESIIRDQMLDFFMENNKIRDKQFGFLPGRSCTLQFLYCVHKWINDLENNHTVAVLYTDFRIAFDSVSHRQLIRRLEMLGIVGMLLTWIVSFFD